MHILYYITAHGYGHGVRSSSIINGIPSSISVTIRTSLPETFFREEINRPFIYRPGVFDCGCSQIDGVVVDTIRTLMTYQEIASQNRRRLDEEVLWCKEHGVSCIVADATPFAVDIANKASVPSVVVSNFTWYDIYSEYVKPGDLFSSFLEEMKLQYCSADLFLALYPANPMEYLKNRIDISVVGRKGVSQREKLISHYKLENGKKIGLIYFGEWGKRSACWTDLGKLTEWEFLSLYPVEGNPANLHIIQKEHFRYQDLTASADVVISKPGYGVLSECFVNGVPLLYIPRENFAEYPVMVQAIEKWGSGLLIPEHDFLSLNWKPYLDTIGEFVKPSPVFSDGVNECVNGILNVASFK